MNTEFKQACEKLGVPTHTLQVVIPQPVYQDLQQNATKNDITVNQLIRDMIDYYFTSDYTD